MRETYCYICNSRLWGEKPDPESPHFTLGHCYQHGWVPDHKGEQVVYESKCDALIHFYRRTLKKVDNIFGFCVYKFGLRKDE